MEAADRELLIEVLKRDVRLERLYHEHQKLEEKLSHFFKRPFLTKAEELEQKDLKRKKLAGVDQIMRLLEPHRPVAA